MYTTVTLAPGISLLVDESAAESLRRQLGTGAAEPGATGGRQEPAPPAEVFDDEHPLWERHTGLAGHRGREWRWPEDAARAETFYASIGGKAKVFLDLLIDRPGQLLDVEDICALRPAAFSGSRSIAGALNGLRKAHLGSDRRYPFYWWAGEPTRYGMKPLVAKLFGQARRRLEG